MAAGIHSLWNHLGMVSTLFLFFVYFFGPKRKRMMDLKAKGSKIIDINPRFLIITNPGFRCSVNGVL